MKNLSLFILLCLLPTVALKAQMAGANAYIKGTNLEIGVNGLYGFEGIDITATPPLAGMHARSGTNYFGFVANPQLNAWATFDGDFFAPGSPENGWGLEIGSGTGIIVNNNCQNLSFGVNDVPGSSTYNVIGSCIQADYNGTVTTGGTNLGVHINYNLGQTDLYYTTTVSITNNTSATIPELYYHRNLDPDNNVSINGGDYSTQNTIVSQPGGPSGCNLAHVKATSTNPASQPQSYLGLAAVGANFRVSWGGFSNRDASDLWAWTNATTYFPNIEQTVGGTAFNDCAISLSYKINNLAPGATETFKFVVILDDAAAANAIDNLLYFTYIGASGTPPSACNPTPDSINTCGAAVPIQINGSIVNDYTWSWSPATGLSGTTGPIVTANPGVSTLYTVTGTPVSSCLAPMTMQVWVIVTPSAGANPFISYIPNQCTGYPPFNLTVDSTGGVWSGTGITNPTLGTFTPGSVAPGTYMITYTTPGGCNSIDTAMVTVIGSNSATITQPPIICVGTAPFALTAVDGGGVWSGTGITNSSTGMFDPSTTGANLITYAFSGTCPLQDTVIVNVVPTFTYAVSQSSTNSCLLDPVQLSINTMAPTGSYTYDWSPGTSLSDSTIANPLATFISPGTHTYTVTVTNSFGCAQTSTFSVVAASAFSPVISAIGDTTMCGSNLIPLSATFDGASVPATCGPSTTGGCGGAAFMNVVGTGTTSNGATDYPAPYGNYYTSVKQQYLYTAAELNAAGITGGKIDQLDFNVTAIAGITTYHFYSISMGCTNLTTFASSPIAFESGLTNVFSAGTYTIGMGWNSHPFATAFNWDGISNVIVEVCFNELNPGSNWTNNSSTTNTATTNFSSIVSLSDSQDQCSLPASWITGYMAHPNIRFHYCSVIPNPANYTYLWTPASGVITDSTAQNTTALPPATMDYYVTVTDIAGGCSDVDTITVTVLPFTGVNPFISYIPNHCTSDAPTNLTINSPGGTWTGPGITDDSLGTFDPSGLAAGTYMITYVAPGSCDGADTAMVTVMAAPSATITQPAPMCEGVAAFNLTPASPGGTWSGPGITDSINGTFDPAVAGTYVVTYTIGGLCPSQDTVTIVVNSVSVPTTGFSYPASPVCVAGPNPSPTGVASFTTGGVYSSTPFGLTLNPSTGVPNLTTSTGGTYTITYFVAATACGPSGSSTTTLVVTPLTPPVTGFSYPDPTVCPSDSSQFPILATGFEAGGTYSSTGGLVVDSLTGQIIVTASAPGTYTVTYSIPVNPDSCMDAGSNTATFTINPLPAITTSADVLMYIGENATLYATGGSSYVWTPADGICVNSACDTITVSPSETTNYCVTVDTLGCIDSTCIKVQIEIPCVTNRDLTVPNAFTPNGDNINDELCLEGWTDCVQSFEIMIYDRWGEKVFESTDSHFCWDGIYNGRQLDPAVFVYFIRASYNTEGATIRDPKKIIQINKTGNISLVR